MKHLLLNLVLHTRTHWEWAKGIVLASLWVPKYSALTGAAQSAYQTGLNVQAQGNVVLPTTFAVSSATETVIPNPQNTSAALIAPLPPNQPQNANTPLDFIVSGEIQTTASGTVELKLYSGTSTTVGNDTKIADSGAVTQNTLTVPFEFHVHLVLGATSGKIGGWFEGFINNTLITRTALNSVLSGLSNAANPVINVLPSITSSGATSGTPTTITLTQYGWV